MKMNLPLQLKAIKETQDPSIKLRIVRNLKGSLLTENDVIKDGPPEKDTTYEYYAKDIRFISKEDR